jgi:probable F420-dependent oxidoreductase
MARLRPFRFGAGVIPVTSREGWIAYARRVEALGYSTLCTGDHPSLGGLAPLPAFLVAAEATTSLRFATQVLNNDLRHPTMLAHEALTFDLLTKGRLELGIGAGWLAQDYHALGIPFNLPSVRLPRLVEAVALIKQILRGGSVTYVGKYYQVSDLNLQLAPAQSPRLPIFIGGGREQILSFAAHEADIVGLDLRSSAGVMDMASYTAAAMDEQVNWLRQAAGGRFDSLELHTLVHTVIITDERQNGVEQVLKQHSQFRTMGVINDVVLSGAEILESPHILIGTVDQIVAELHERRARYGISYISVFGDLTETFAPVVKRLAGK